MTESSTLAALEQAPRANGEGKLYATRFYLGTDEYVMLSLPALDIPTPEGLTQSEALVFRAILAGRTNHEIATAKRRSFRTVANQVATVFRKLNVTSRVELIVKYGGCCGG
ncbi:MAG TPA: helix-turn-helix transcriptional regulator [Polyangiaceae bacterium]|jgi:DNA-binding NarL/FixJ family response regulator|nr:helix-turn-helix transcriptional regulator [Polyangiaceae bacterium]